MGASHNIWGKAFLHSVRKPFHFFIWLTVLVFVIRLLQQMFIQDEIIKALSSSFYRGGVLLLSPRS